MIKLNFSRRSQHRDGKLPSVLREIKEVQIFCYPEVPRLLKSTKLKRKILIRKVLFAFTPKKK